MDPESIPNTSSEPEAPEPEEWPEPAPYWENAFQEWRWGWDLHVYGFATLFLAMGVYAGYFFVLQIYHGLDKKYLSVSLNAVMLLLCFTRAFVLYFDPYHQGHMIEAVLFMRIIWSIGSPCLTSADFLVLMSLVETSHMKLAPPKLQKLKYIALIIGGHFVIVMITDTVVSDFVEAKAMLLMCQMLFVAWGTTLAISYFVVGRQLDIKLFSHKLVKDKKDKQYVYLIYASGGTNIFLCGLMLYSAFGVFGVYSGGKFVDKWHWFMFQTVSRILEGIACVLIFTVSAKRKRVKKTVEDMERKDQSTTETLEVSRNNRRQSMFSYLRDTYFNVNKDKIESEIVEELEEDEGTADREAEIAAKITASQK